MSLCSARGETRIAVVYECCLTSRGLGVVVRLDVDENEDASGGGAGGNRVVRGGDARRPLIAAASSSLAKCRQSFFLLFLFLRASFANSRCSRSPTQNFAPSSLSPKNGSSSISGGRGGGGQKAKNAAAGSAAAATSRLHFCILPLFGRRLVEL